MGMRSDDTSFNNCNLKNQRQQFYLPATGWAKTLTVLIRVAAKVRTWEDFLPAPTRM